MMRSLWTASTGMTAQQLNVDVISNNLANVNTTGFKKERLEFKTMLYQTMQRASLDPANNATRPVNLQVGLGVRSIGTSRVFETGNLEQTLKNFDFALEGPGMFVIQTEKGVVYTKDGSFKISIVDEGRMLVTSEGYPVLSTTGESIIIPNEVDMNMLNVSYEGLLVYRDEDGNEIQLDTQIAVVQFANMQGLESLGSNTWGQTVASGEPIYEYEGELASSSRIVQGYLERSNVQVAEEMVKLIVAQRAYELNSKAITTSDEMLQLANNLKR